MLQKYPPFVLKKHNFTVKTTKEKVITIIILCNSAAIESGISYNSHF